MVLQHPTQGLDLNRKKNAVVETLQSCAEINAHKP